MKPGSIAPQVRSVPIMTQEERLGKRERSSGIIRIPSQLPPRITGSLTSPSGENNIVSMGVFDLWMG